MPIQREQTPITGLVNNILREKVTTSQPDLQVILIGVVSENPEKVLRALLDLEQVAYDQLVMASNAVHTESLLHYIAVHSLLVHAGVAQFLPARDFSLLRQPLEAEEVEEEKDEIEYENYRAVIKNRLAEITNWVDGQFATVKLIPKDEFEQQLCKAFPDINPDDAHNAALYLANISKLMDRSRSGKSFIPHVESEVAEQESQPQDQG